MDESQVSYLRMRGWCTMNICINFLRTLFHVTQGVKIIALLKKLFFPSVFISQKNISHLIYFR